MPFKFGERCKHCGEWCTYIGFSKTKGYHLINWPNHGWALNEARKIGILDTNDMSILNKLIAAGITDNLYWVSHVA